MIGIRFRDMSGVLKLKWILILILCISPAESPARAQNYQNWYPNGINLPAGHNYPCAITALPSSLDGIPASDRAFVNHVYAMLLRCVQSKTIMLDSLQDSPISAYQTYYASTTDARSKILAEPVPPGLEPFRNGVVQAIDQQLIFFKKAVQARNDGASVSDCMNFPEGRQASNYLLQAWSVMQAKYPGMSGSLRDSAYHHLCALDLF